MDESKNRQSDTTTVVCFKCNARGHKAVSCPSLVKKCFLCGKQKHEARNCRSGKQRSGGKKRDSLPVQRGQVSAGSLVQPPQVKPTEEEVKACIKDDKLLLASGKKIPIASNACLEPLSGDRTSLHDYDVRMSKFNFCGARKTKTTFFSFPVLRCIL